MKTHYLHRRDMLRIEREARLCFGSPEAPKNIISRLDGVLDKTANVIQTAGEKTAEFVMDFPVLSTIVKDVYNAGQEHIDTKTQETLVDRGAWAKTLQSADLFTLLEQAPLSIDRTHPVTTDQLFLAMSPEQRRAVFFEQVDFLIPQGVKDNYELNQYNSTEERVKDLGASGIERYRRAMLGILGLNKLDTKIDAGAHELAKTSLEQHLLTGHFPGTVSRGLDLGYAEALKRNSLTGKEPFATLPQALHGNLPPSALKGALTLGVIDAPILRKLNKIFIEHEHDGDVLETSLAGREELKSITEKRLRKEAKGVADIWRELGGFEKLALVAMGALALSTKVGRGIAMIFGGAYFFNKFVLKDKDPLKSWSKNAQRNLINPVKKALSPVLGPYEADQLDPATRAGIVTKFLDSFDRKNMEEQGMGLLIMLDLPLDILARNFKSTGPGTFRLNLGADGTVDDAIRQMDPEMKKAFNTFFSSSTNRDMATEAMGYVFYRMATKNPLERKAADKIENVLNRLPSGSLHLLYTAETMRAPGGASHARLPHRESDELPINGPSVKGTEPIPNTHEPVSGLVSAEELVEAGQEYVRLVERGRKLAVGDPSTLRSFMLSTMDLKPYKPEAAPPGPTNVAAPGPANAVATGPTNAVPPQGPTPAVAPGPTAPNAGAPGPTNNTPPGPTNSAPPGPTNNPPPGPTNNPPVGPTNVAPAGPANIAPAAPTNVTPNGPANVAPAGPANVAPAAPSNVTPNGPTTVAPGAPAAAPAPAPTEQPAPGPAEIDAPKPAENTAPGETDLDAAGPAKE